MGKILILNKKSNFLSLKLILNLIFFTSNCLQALDDRTSVSGLLDRLLRSEDESRTLAAYQVAFDLCENENQKFAIDVSTNLPTKYVHMLALFFCFFWLFFLISSSFSQENDDDRSNSSLSVCCLFLFLFFYFFLFIFFFHTNVLT